MARSVDAAGLGARRRPTSARPVLRRGDGRRARRCARRRAPRRRGAPVLIGGEVAEAYDTQQALARDTRLIVPVTLVLVLLILACCCARVVMPLYVVGDRAPLVRVRARGELAALHARARPAGQRPEPAAVRVHLPRRAGRRLQRLPARPDPRGASRAAAREAAVDRRARAHRRRDHERRPRARRDVRRADGAADSRRCSRSASSSRSACSPTRSSSARCSCRRSRSCSASATGGRARSSVDRRTKVVDSPAISELVCPPHD